MEPSAGDDLIYWSFSDFLLRIQHRQIFCSISMRISSLKMLFSLNQTPTTRPPTTHFPQHLRIHQQIQRHCINTSKHQTMQKTHQRLVRKWLAMTVTLLLTGQMIIWTLCSTISVIVITDLKSRQRRSQKLIKLITFAIDEEVES